MSVTDICVLNNKLSQFIAYNIHNDYGEVNYQNCFDYDFAIQHLVNQFKNFIIFANVANDNELKDTQQFCIDNKINLFIIAYERYKYTQLKDKHLIHLTCNTYYEQQNMFNILNKKIKELMSNE